MATNTNTASVVLTDLLDKIGALSLLLGLYKIAFPTKNQKNSKNCKNKGISASRCFLNSFVLFTASNLIKTNANNFAVSTVADKSKSKKPGN